MEDRIGQRLLRMFGLPLAVAGEKPDKPEKAEILAPPGERMPRMSEDRVARFEANPFLGEEAWTPREMPDAPRAAPADEGSASQVAEHAAPAPAREEVTEKAPAHLEQAETKEKQEVEEGHEAESRDQEERDEEDRPGGAWLLEEGAQEEAERSRGLRQREALGEESRCHGTVEDGTRCLRKPIDGKAYCLEHTAGSAGEEPTVERVEARRADRSPD